MRTRQLRSEPPFPGERSFRRVGDDLFTRTKLTSDSFAAVSAEAGSKQEVRWVHAARGMAIFLVVLHHAVLQTVSAGISEPEWTWLTESLRTMRMPLFFMAAGLFAGKWIQQKSWRDMLGKKVLLFLWVFALWVPLRWAWLRLIPGWDDDEAFSRLISRFILPNGGWFIFALAIFFIVAKATVRLDPRVQLVIAMAISIVFLPINVGNVGWNGVLTLYVFFLFGVYSRDWTLRAAESTPLVARVGIVVAWPVLVAAAMWFDLIDAPVISFALRALGLAAGVIIAVWLAPVAFLRGLGKNTLPIYMTHSLVIMGIVWLVAQVWSNPPLPVAVPFLVAVIALLVSLGFGLLAPRIKLGWLFETPWWLTYVYGRATRSRADVRVAPERSDRAS